MATEFADKEVVATLSLYLILNVSLFAPSFKTIKAILPAGVLKATELKFPDSVELILTEF